MNPYLLAYNTLLCLGWGYCLVTMLMTVFLKNGNSADVYKAVELPLKIFQTAAIMEIIHSATGIVRSPVPITVTQVFSRLWIVWGIINLAPEAATQGKLEIPFTGGLGLNFISLLTAWSVTEVVRYGFFALKELDAIPYPLLWLRYSTFLPLYPIGVASELTMVYLALPVIKAKSIWSIQMPNLWNFAFDYYWLCILIVILYLPGLPQLYLYMLSQRKKVLSPNKTKEKAA